MPWRNHGGAVTTPAGGTGIAFTHESSMLYAAPAAKATGRKATRAVQTKHTRFRKDMQDHALRFVLFAVLARGYMGNAAARLCSAR